MTKPYRISIKRDFGRYGYWCSKTRTNRKDGFVVSGPSEDGSWQVGNCIPGAGWFRTIEDAMLGIEVHMKTGDTMAFHDEYRRRKAERDTV